MEVNKDEAKSAAMAAAENGSSKNAPFSNIMVGPMGEQQQEKGGGLVAAAAAGSSATKIKLKISRLTEEPADSFSHICKECGKGFSSGKALGGHMSSAHVQAKDKLKARLDGDSDDEKHTCGICHKEFPSSKSLYGHMRLHPERQWRGMEPRSHPPSLSASQLMDKVDENGYGIDSLEFSEEAEGFDADSNNGNEIGVDEYDLTASLGLGWGTTGRRGQKFGVQIFDFADFADEEEKETVIQAARELVKLARGPPTPLTLVNDESFTPSMESARYTKFPPKSRNSSQLVMYSSSDDDSEKILVAGNVLFGNGKSPIDSASSSFGKDLDDGGVGRIKRRKLAGKPPNEAAQQALTPLPETHKCSTCNKSFSSHQALGGHRSSHNKVKIHVQNAIDQINPEEFHSLSMRLPEWSEIEGAGKASSDALKVSTDHTGYLHECEVCGKGFPTGQALGGHKRCHYTAGGFSSAAQSPPSLDEFGGGRFERKIHGFDLNVLPAEDDCDI